MEPVFPVGSKDDRTEYLTGGLSDRKPSRSWRKPARELWGVGRQRSRLGLSAGFGARRRKAKTSLGFPSRQQDPEGQVSPEIRQRRLI